MSENSFLGEIRKIINELLEVNEMQTKKHQREEREGEEEGERGRESGGG